MLRRSPTEVRGRAFRRAQEDSHEERKKVNWEPEDSPDTRRRPVGARRSRHDGRRARRCDAGRHVRSREDCRNLSADRNPVQRERKVGSHTGFRVLWLSYVRGDGARRGVHHHQPAASPRPRARTRARASASAGTRARTRARASAGASAGAQGQAPGQGQGQGRGIAPDVALSALQGMTAYYGTFRVDDKSKSVLLHYDGNMVPHAPDGKYAYRI